MIHIPPLTEERRKDLVKKANEEEKPKKGKNNANIFAFVKFAHKNSAKRTVRFSQDVEKKNLNTHKVKV